MKYALAILFGLTLGGANAQNLTIDKLIDIKHPENPVWSPDGRQVAFVWERAGIGNIYIADASGQTSQPAQRTHFEDGTIAGIFWSADGKAIYFPHKGGLWQAPIGEGVALPAWTSTAPESDFALSPNGKSVAFVRAAHPGNDLMIRTLADGKETRLIHDGAGIGGVSWSADGAKLAYSAGSRTIHHDDAPDYSGAKIIYTVTERTPGRLSVIPAAGGKPVTFNMTGNGRWAGSASVVSERQSADYKKRTIYVSGKAIHEDTDDQFWSIGGNAVFPSPDGKWIAFLAESNGWDHLFVMPTGGGEPVVLTKGNFEVKRPVWSHDSTRIAFDANEPDHNGDRRLGVAAVSNGTVTYVTAGKGTNTAPAWSPDDQRLVYQHTDLHNSADLFVTEAKAGSTPVRLSDSMPAGIDRSAFVEPEFVHFPGADGKSVPGWLFVPKNLDRTKKHPAIVWIHGDGTNQNYDGWHIQRNYAVYYSFHQYLLQKGYVVFAPDYRGSIGYSRDWRNGVYMDVGGQDAKDAWMSANYLKTLPYVDGDRLGVWGLSYGGFFTLIAVTDQPTLFRAAVDVAGVVDYAQYYTDPYHGGWTASRIGTPEQNPEVFKRAAPIDHFDRLAHPLLILHGTADVNVPYVETVRLLDKIQKEGKGDLVSFMAYPGEFHYFTRAQVLNDAWHRVEKFFDANLAP